MLKSLKTLAPRILTIHAQNTLQDLCFFGTAGSRDFPLCSGSTWDCSALMHWEARQTLGISLFVAASLQKIYHLSTHAVYMEATSQEAFLGESYTGSNAKHDSQVAYTEGSVAPGILSTCQEKRGISMAARQTQYAEFGGCLTKSFCSKCVGPLGDAAKASRGWHYTGSPCMTRLRVIFRNYSVSQAR